VHSTPPLGVRVGVLPSRVWYRKTIMMVVGHIASEAVIVELVK